MISSSCECCHPFILGHVQPVNGWAQADERIPVCREVMWKPVTRKFPRLPTSRIIKIKKGKNIHRKPSGLTFIRPRLSTSWKREGKVLRVLLSGQGWRSLPFQWRFRRALPWWPTQDPFLFLMVGQKSSSVNYSRSFGLTVRLPTLDESIRAAVSRGKDRWLTVMIQLLIVYRRLDQSKHFFYLSLPLGITTDWGLIQ